MISNSYLIVLALSLFLIGINTGLRVNDVVRLHVRDLKENKLFSIREGKTKNRREINVGMVKEEIERFIDGKPLDAYLFKSQKGSKAISATQVYRILNDTADL